MCQLTYNRKKRYLNHVKKRMFWNLTIQFIILSTSPHCSLLYVNWRNRFQLTLNLFKFTSDFAKSCWLFFSLSFKIQSRRWSQISQPPSTLTTQKVWHQITVAWYPEITATLVIVKNWGVSDWPQGAVKCFLKYRYLCVRDLLAIHAK